MQEWLVSVGKVLLWLGGGLFPIVLAISIAAQPGSDLETWREVLMLLFLGSVMIGTALMMADGELGEG